MSKQKEYAEMYYFGYFKKLYESWEESTNKMMDVWMNSPFMDRAVEKSSEFKDYIHGFIEQTLETRCSPQKREMGRLVDIIDSLEAKIAELEQKIASLESRPARTAAKRAAAKKPARKAKEKK
ncbi:MAG: hypothetical protein IT344_06790 [Candidatus Dadabacteria bacterium]|nr:hypothetical protein [Candidatus Dadabacteria bacterium]